MASEGVHELKKDLSRKTRDMHRALVSLREELEAIDWYRQRAEACRDSQLKEILLHNMREEMEHAAMLIEWLRNKDGDFDSHLRTFMFSDASLTETRETAAGHSRTVTYRTATIGSLKE